MCTLSWRPTENGYILRFNRDEQRSRKTALPPAHRQRNNVTFLAPTDAERGGTWMLVNTHGLSICLLNHYPEIPAPPLDKTESRGKLMLDLTDCTNITDAINRCSSMSLNAYPPFQLVAIDVTGGMQLTWNGRAYMSSALNKKGAMLSSSSFRPKAVVDTRHEIFKRIVGDINTVADEQLEAFHYQRDTDSAASVRMSRPDACTHNISRIEISGQYTHPEPEHHSAKKAVATFYYEPQKEISPNDQPVNLGLELDSSTPVCEPGL